MDSKNDCDKIDEVMLPGFRFHPTDEELVGFYLKRKIQQRPLPIELIKQVDIYKYDPWDLPNLAPTGEKEWYFYCPRDRKYRNSARPNRVTGAGFWKATGTDRPIYSSDSTKCIGLKKSLVFYRGRAAKGIKTDWMMHEFRLPSISDSAPPKKFMDKNLPPNDAWAICRIFKKTNSMAQRALTQCWVSPITETTASDIFTQASNSTHFASENTSFNNFQPTSFDIPSYRPINQTPYKSSLFSNTDPPNGSFMFSPSPDQSEPSKCTADVSSLLFNISSPAFTSGDISKASESVDFGGPHHHFNNAFSISSPQDAQNVRAIGFPFSLADEWKPSLPWDSPPCPSEISTTYSTNKCYT